jgi:hypothetical protein
MRFDDKGKAGWSHYQVSCNCILTTATSLAFIVGYFRLIGFSEMQIGIYGGIIGLAGLFNIIGSWITQRSRDLKKVYLKYFSISIAFFVIGILISYIFQPITNNILAATILLFLFLWHAFMSMTTSALLPWLNNIIGNNNWGNFFSTRLIIRDISAFIASFIVGIYLGNNPKISDFLLVFLLASIFGVLNNYFINKVPGVVIDVQTFDLSSYVKIIKNIFKQDKFKCLFLLLFSRAFAYGLITPFQPIFLLEQLGLNYSKIAIIVNLSIVSSVLTYKSWARIQNKYGNYTGLKWCTILSIFVPFLWMFSSQNNILPIYLAVIVVGLSSLQGIAGGGYYTSGIGMIYEHSDDNYKPIYTALYFFINGTATFISPIIGGFLLDRFNKIPLEIPLINIELGGYRLLFLISGIILILETAFLPIIKKHFSSDHCITS